MLVLKVSCTYRVSDCCVSLVALRCSNTNAGDEDESHTSVCMPVNERLPI